MIRICSYLGLLGLATAVPAYAQDPAWSGSARCEITVAGTGYTDRQTHTWAIVGGAPTKRGAFNIYPGTWSVTGGGSLNRTTGDQTLHAQWTRSATGISAPISMVTRASDGAVLIAAAHAQLRVRDAVSGTQEVRRGGQVISSTRIGIEAFEHSFPAIQGDSRSTHLAGQKSETPKGSFGPMQPANSSVHVNCTWDFRRSDSTAVTSPPT